MKVRLIKICLRRKSTRSRTLVVNRRKRTHGGLWTLVGDPGRGSRKRKHDSSAASTCSEDSERSMDFGQLQGEINDESQYSEDPKIWKFYLYMGSNPWQFIKTLVLTICPTFL